MARISVKVIAYGFAALLVVLGVILLLAGYNLPAANGGEIGAGWTLIGVGVVIWIVGFAARYLRHLR